LYDELVVDLPCLHPKQELVKIEAGRRNVVNCGRRFGKTILGEDLTIEPALDGRRVGWFAPEYKLLAEAWRDMLAILDPVILRKDSNEKRIELITGGVIEAWSFDRSPNAGRSRKYHRVVFDEAAHCANLEASWTKGVRATLTDYQGDAWFLSSPNGENFFHVLYQRGANQEPQWAGWKSWTFTSYDNPYITPSEIDEAKLELPDWVFNQEYLAQFHAESENALIPAFWIERAATPAIAQECDRLRGQGKGGRKRLAADLGYGTGADKAVILVGDDLGILEIHASRFTAVPEAAQKIAELCGRWGVQDDRVTFDANGPGRDMPRYLEVYQIHAVPYHGSGKGGLKHANKRSRSAWRLRQRLDPERPIIPRQEADDNNPWKAPPELRAASPQPPFAIPGMPGDMREELAGLRYHMDKQRIALELKEDYAKRLGRSPDYADALMMLFSLGDMS
jgi:hypothetical protein